MRKTREVAEDRLQWKICHSSSVYMCVSVCVSACVCPHVCVHVCVSVCVAVCVSVCVSAVTHHLFRLCAEEDNGLCNVLWHWHSEPWVNACNTPLTGHTHRHTIHSTVTHTSHTICQHLMTLWRPPPPPVLYLSSMIPTTYRPQQQCRLTDGQVLNNAVSYTWYIQGVPEKPHRV